MCSHAGKKKKTTSTTNERNKRGKLIAEQEIKNININKSYGVFSMALYSSKLVQVPDNQFM